MFKPGMKVRVIKPSFGLKVGQVITITMRKMTLPSGPFWTTPDYSGGVWEDRIEPFEWKAGDKVKIVRRPTIEELNNDNINWTFSMENHVGKIVTFKAMSKLFPGSLRFVEMNFSWPPMCCEYIGPGEIAPPIPAAPVKQKRIINAKPASNSGV